MPDSELKPCPFCGEQPQSNYFKDAMGSVATIKCINDNCITRDPICVEKVNMKLAIKAWNTRSRPSDEPKKELKPYPETPSDKWPVVDESKCEHCTCDVPRISHNDTSRIFGSTCAPRVEVSEERLFEIISKFNTVNPDRFYNPKAMNEDRELALMICEAFSAPRVEITEEDIVRIITDNYATCDDSECLYCPICAYKTAKAIKQEIEK